MRRPITNSACGQPHVVLDEGVDRQRGVGPDIDQLQIGVLAQAQAPHLGLRPELDLALP